MVHPADDIIMPIRSTDTKAALASFQRAEATLGPPNAIKDYTDRSQPLLYGSFELNANRFMGI
jgi:hypothetical protein